MATDTANPFAHLSETDIEKLTHEFDAIHDEVYADLGERDRRYIKTVIGTHRALAVAGRVILLASSAKVYWVLGTGLLSLAKILENMEIGHNVMHGQWDWMNDPEIHSSTWDWDAVSTAESWKHSHNYIHHTFTNIRGKDKDLGYEIMRIDPHQKWHPIYLAQPLYNVLLMALFEWGVAVHDLDLEAVRRGEKPRADVWRDLKSISGKAWRQVYKDYLGWPLVSAGAFGLAQAVLRGRLDQPKSSRIGRRLQRLWGSRGGRWSGVVAVLDRRLSGVEKTYLSTLSADITANIIRNVWAHAIIFCGHFPDQTYTFSQEETENETRGGWYLRQLVGAANIDGSPLFHVISGNLGYQVEHHLYPDMPSTRYSQIAPQIKEICARYQLPYNTGPLWQQWWMVHRSIARLALPGGRPRTKPGPYRRGRDTNSAGAPSEAQRFRSRLPAESPFAGPEHESGGVEVAPPPRSR